MDRKKEIEEAYGRKRLTDLTVLDLPDILEYVIIILSGEKPDKNIKVPEVEAN